MEPTELAFYIIVPVTLLIMIVVFVYLILKNRKKTQPKISAETGEIESSTEEELEETPKKTGPNLEIVEKFWEIEDKKKKARKKVLNKFQTEKALNKLRNIQKKKSPKRTLDDLKKIKSIEPSGEPKVVSKKPAVPPQTKPAIAEKPKVVPPSPIKIDKYDNKYKEEAKKKKKEIAPSLDKIKKLRDSTKLSRLKKMSTKPGKRALEFLGQREVRLNEEKEKKQRQEEALKTLSNMSEQKKKRKNNALSNLKKISSSKEKKMAKLRTVRK